MASFLGQLSPMRNGSGQRRNQERGFAHGGNLFSIDPGKGCGRVRVPAAKCLNILATALGTTLAPCRVFDTPLPLGVDGTACRSAPP
jgi:hypothetical protein